MFRYISLLLATVLCIGLFLADTPAPAQVQQIGRFNLNFGGGGFGGLGFRQSFRQPVFTQQFRQRSNLGYGYNQQFRVQQFVQPVYQQQFRVQQFAQPVYTQQFVQPYVQQVRVQQFAQPAYVQQQVQYVQPLQVQAVQQGYGGCVQQSVGYVQQQTGGGCSAFFSAGY